MMNSQMFGIRDRVVATVVLSVLAACTLTILNQSWRAREHAESVFAAQSMLIAGQARSTIATGDASLTASFFADLEKAADGQSAYNTLVAVAAYDRRAARIGGSSREAIEPGQIDAMGVAARAAMERHSQTIERVGDRLVVSTPLAADEAAPPTGAVTTVWNTSAADAAIRAETITKAAQAVVGSLLLMLVVMITLDRCLVAPVKRLQTHARTIARARDARALEDDGLTARRDEIGELARAFDAMIRDIAEGQARLAAQARELQGRNAQLDTALANMSQGLCMYDADGGLALVNQRFASIYNIPRDAIAPGMSFWSVLETLEQHGCINEAEMRRAATDHERALRKGARADFTQHLADGRSVAIAQAMMDRGGWVTTYEDISERVAAEQQINHMALHDPLTELPNRALFRQTLNKATSLVRRGSRCAVLCLDLDHFKQVNDTLGHPVGDQLLCAVADRLRDCVREHDTVARLGGDEFAVVQTEITDTVDASNLARRIVETLSRPYEIGAHQIVIGASVGVAMCPGDGDDCDQLLKCADMALYRAKFDGRGRHRFFEAEMDARMQARRLLEIELRAALQQEQFEVYFQPLVDIETRMIAGFEALVRWNHPQRGVVSPGEFIPLAEEINLIGELGLWVLRKATAEAASWKEPLKISINLSPLQFRCRTLVDDILAAVADARLDPRRLELEITESVILADTEQVLATLHRLRDAGISITMDDFGTGYSSLGYLQKFPFDRIKIDRSFVTNLRQQPNSLSIIKAITDLGSCLGIATTAEGVETSEQLEKLRSSGCSIVQGYLFSEAIPARSIGGMIDDFNRADRRAA